MPRETLEQFPALDFVLRGEPELTLRELMDTIMTANGLFKVQDGKLLRADGKPTDENGHLAYMMKDADPMWTPAWALETADSTPARRSHALDAHAPDRHSRVGLAAQQ